MREVGEGLLVAAVAVFFGNTLSECLLFIVADFDTDFAESILKGWAWQPPPTRWQFEHSLGAIAIGPIVEELVFRGLVLRRLAARWGNSAAIIGSSVVFGILHVDQAVGATVFGVAMALLYMRSHTLAVPIAAHMANNFAASLMREYYPETYTVTLAQLHNNLGWDMLILGLSAPAVVYYCYRYWPRRQDVWPLVGVPGTGAKA
jgi:membrane protease YdiL (CAAX protease family)